MIRIKGMVTVSQPMVGSDGNVYNFFNECIFRSMNIIPSDFELAYFMMKARWIQFHFFSQIPVGEYTVGEIVLEIIFRII